MVSLAEVPCRGDEAIITHDHQKIIQRKKGAMMSSTALQQCLLMIIKITQIATDIEK